MDVVVSAAHPGSATEPIVAPDLQQWRDDCRRHLLAARCAVPVLQRRQWNRAVTQRLQDAFPLSDVMSGMVIGAYWPFRGEFDPRFLLRQWRKGGGRVTLPVVAGKHAPLQFREWWPGAPMVKGSLGLSMPDGTEVLSPQVVLIPPVGFDERGYRLGYGGGYFDRTLATMHPQPLKIGVAFELSRMATIQPQPHDVPMDFIATEAGLYRVGDDGLTLLDGSWQWDWLPDRRRDG